MDKLSPKAVIFDLGSTLIEYETLGWSELAMQATNSTWDFLSSRGYEIPEKEHYVEVFESIKHRYRDHALKTLQEWTVPQVATEVLKGLGLEPDGKLIDDFFAAYYAPVEAQLFAYDDTIETLEKIRGTIPVVGLISNTIFPEQTHHGELERFGITPFLDFTLFSSTFGKRKPHEDIFIKAANLAGLAPAECVYVGDRYVEDIEGPSGVGMSAILKIKEGREYPEEMPLATRRIHTLAELEEHLEL
ncbi:MAG: HAD family hydrolase [candidate division Zixibacteria bacterium]|nr:HAD family hydrolase [candidate division Zixibacteria bacterium]